MLGKPKYKLGDKVCFKIEDDIYWGEICIIDKYGTFENDSDVSYDIMYEKEGVKYLFKHVTESLII